MLTSALNFLSEKRKRLHRSETMPIFTNDPNQYKLESNLQNNVNLCELIQGVNHPISNSINLDSNHVYPESKYQRHCHNQQQQSEIRQIGINIETDLQNQVTSSTRKNKYKNVHKNRNQYSLEDSDKNLAFNTLSQGHSMDNLHLVSNPKYSITSKYGEENENLENLISITNRSLTSSNPRNSNLDNIELTNSYSLNSHTPDTQIEINYKRTKKYIASGKSRTTRIRAKAAVKAAKGKLKRSKSTAHMSRHMRNSSTEDDQRGRSISANRDNLGDANENLTNQSLNDSKVKIGSKSKANLYEDKSRSRSFNISRTLCQNIKEDNENNKINLMDYLTQLAMKGSKSEYVHIYPTDCTFSNNIETDINNGPFILNTNNIKYKSTDNSLHHLSTMSSFKVNRHVMIHKLRRINSSITCPSENKHLVHTDLDQNFIQASSTAGDLLLPSRNGKLNKFIQEPSPEFIQNISKELFAVIEQHNFGQFLKIFNKLIQLDDKCLRDIRTTVNDFDLSALDYALLTAGPSLILVLLVSDFQLGPILQHAINCGPSIKVAKDTMQMHLSLRLEKLESQLKHDRMQAKQAVCQVNELASLIADNESKNLNSDNVEHVSVLNKAFAKVNAMDKCHLESLAKFEHVRRLSHALDMYPLNSLPKPKFVHIMIYDSNAILIRISPSRGKYNCSNESISLGRKSVHLPIRDFMYEQQSSCDTSSTELDSDLNENRGRKLSNNQLGYCYLSHLTLRYRIEWSFCPRFTNSQVFHCLVNPPVRGEYFNETYPKPNHPKWLRVGFYSIHNLPTNKMIFVRVYSFSIRGWSEPGYSQPRGLIISSWYKNSIVQSNRTINSKLESMFPKLTPNQMEVITNSRFIDDEFQIQINTFKMHLIKQIIAWISGQSVKDQHQQQQQQLHHSELDQSNKNLNLSTCSIASLIDESAKRTRSPLLQRKRSFRFPFSNKGLKFCQKTKSGIYLACICHTNVNFVCPFELDTDFSNLSKLVLVDDCLPILNVTREDNLSESNLMADFYWFSRFVVDSVFDMDVQMLGGDISSTNPSLPSTLQFRLKLLETLQKFKLLLGTNQFDCLYPEIIRTHVWDTSEGSLNEMATKNTGTDSSFYTESNTNLNTDGKSGVSAILFVLLKYVDNVTQCALNGNLRWCALNKFIKQNKLKLCTNVENTHPNSDKSTTTTTTIPNTNLHLLINRGNHIILSPESRLLTNLHHFLYYSQAHPNQLDPGLYLVLIQMRASLDQQPTVLATYTDQVIYTLPNEKIRSRSHVSKKEWDLICQLCNKDDGQSTCYEFGPCEYRFLTKLINACYKLFKRLNLDRNQFLHYRLYLPNLIRVSKSHTFIALLPSMEQVCLAPSHIGETPKLCKWLPLIYLERHLGFVYDPSFQKQSQHLLALVDLLSALAQFVQRQCLTEVELSQSVQRTQILQSIQTNLDWMMQTRRWMGEIISIGRDRKRAPNLHLTMEQLLSNKLAINCAEQGSISNLSENYVPNIGPIKFNPHLYKSHRKNGILCPMSHVNSRENVREPSTDERSNYSCPPLLDKKSSLYGNSTTVIHIYTTYQTGLNLGTSVRLLINARTNVKEIIQIVVSKLIKTAEEKNKYKSNSDYYLSINIIKNKIQEDLNSGGFCLTVSVGHSERCLSDNLKPMLLKKPWISGKFTIHLISELLNSTLNSNHIGTGLDPRSDEMANSPCSRLSLLPTTTLFRPNYYGSSFVKISIVQNYLHKAIVKHPPLIYS